MRKFKMFILKLYLKIFKKEAHYINGPVALPEPLSKEEEQELSERLIIGDLNAREKLIVHNLRLVVYIAKKFESSGVNIEDLISIGAYTKGTDPMTDKAIAMNDKINNLFH